MADPEAPEDGAGEGAGKGKKPAAPEKGRGRAIAETLGIVPAVEDAEAPAARPGQLEAAGIAVFVIAGIAGLAILLFGSIAGAEGWQHMRTVELILRIGAVGIVVSFFARSLNPFVVSLGLLLIGALIVPTKDILRFALVLSQSDRELDDFFPESTGGEEYQGADDDLATRIVNRLQEVRKEEGTPFLDPALGVGDRKKALEAIASTILGQRVTTLQVRVQLKGAAHMLLALAEGAFEEYLYRNGRQERFVNDLRFLRAEGLVSYDYENFDAATITALGREVAERLRRGKLGAGTVAARTSDIDATSRALRDGVLQSLSAAQALELDQVLRTCDSNPDTLGAMSLLTAPLALDPPQSIVERVEYAGVAETVRFRFSESFDFAGPVQLDLAAMSPNLDPVLVLVRVEPGFCPVVGYNDDAADSLDARIVFRPAVGEYLAVTFDLSRVSGQMLLTLSEPTHGQAAAAPEEILGAPGEAPAEAPPGAPGDGSVPEDG